MSKCYSKIHKISDKWQNFNENLQQGHQAVEGSRGGICEDNGSYLVKIVSGILIYFFINAF